VHNAEECNLEECNVVEKYISKDGIELLLSGNKITVGICCSYICDDIFFLKDAKSGLVYELKLLRKCKSVSFMLFGNLHTFHKSKFMHTLL